MKAGAYARQDRVGQLVVTEAMGTWPGGLCEVIEMNPDPEGAPNIAMQVRRLEDGDECGVFEDEDVLPVDAAPVVARA